MYGRRSLLLTVLIGIAVAFVFVVGTGFLESPTRAAGNGYRFQVTGLRWMTAVNNGYVIPNSKKAFNSYNQPSVDENGLVVFRARGKGHPRATGVYSAHIKGGLLESGADLLAKVPYPNNLGTDFNEFPSIPRVSPTSGLIATRANHEPVYTYVLPDGSETRAGTTGIYVTERGKGLITAASKLGGVPDFEFFAVPGTDPAVPFDVFPGSPSVTDSGLVVFKGNYTVNGIPKTGAFFRQIYETPGGGKHPAGILATTDTEIPNAPPSLGYREMTFGSVSPPTAAGGRAVFVAVDNEEDPHMGGLYIVDIGETPELEPIVEIGKPVPGLEQIALNRIGEALAFDGRFVTFWGAWGNDTKTVRLYCPEEGNADRRAFCKGGDPLSRFDKEEERWFQEKAVPVRQALFMFDTYTGNVFLVSDTDDFDDFLFWGYTGMVPGVGHEADDSDGEAPRWRSSAYAAVSNGVVAFKARTGILGKKNEYFDPVDGVYLAQPMAGTALGVVVETGMDGWILDPSMPPLLREVYPITELGIEREGLRGDFLAITARMGTEEDGWAGIYVTDVSRAFRQQKDDTPLKVPENRTRGNW